VVLSQGNGYDGSAGGLCADMQLQRSHRILNGGLV
jgi:hypothetical protein